MEKFNRIVGTTYAVLFALLIASALIAAIAFFVRTFV